MLSDFTSPRYRSPVKPEFVAMVASLLDQGLSYALVGRRLGVSKNSIVGIVHRYLPRNVGHQPVEIVARTAPTTRGNSARRETTPERVVTRPAAPVASAPAPSAPRPDTSIRSRPVAVVLAGPGVCRYPLWDADEALETKRFCGAHSGRQTYCPGHAALLYVPPRRRWA